ncbi:hypothetical protein SteCoe_32143 [Stentor coeruleus]|uniref:Peptidase C19 ubiquitin carboxyl-terminal hydrolase domain-containing protein n=1 Tax=Stentor coeruleus TaxID=5963 RepID=A0A1R2B034_9CILI|nr:hypothetical protein SteCoe_32143 [Stentor coeruleus]
MDLAAAKKEYQKYLNWKRKEGLPVNLTNDRSSLFTCLLQSLYMIPYFVRKTFSMPSPQLTGTLSQSQILIQTLQGLFSNMMSSIESSINCNSLIDKFPLFNDKLNNNILIKDYVDSFFKGINKAFEDVMEKSKTAKKRKIKKMFIGEILQRIKYWDIKGTKKLKNEKIEFCEIEVENFCGNFYNAVDKTFQRKEVEINDGKGGKISGYQTLWINKDPKIMLFHANVKKNQVKMSDGTIEILKNFYPKVFRLSNKTEVKKFRTEKSRVDSKLRVLIEKMNYLSTLNLTTHISNIISYLPQSSQDLSLSLQRLNTQSEQYTQNLESSISHSFYLKSSIFQIKGAFKPVFQLHAIIIREQKSELDNFFCLIYDNYKKIWKLYDRNAIQEVNESEFLQLCTTNIEQNNVVAMIYVKDTAFKRKTDLPMQNFSVNTNVYKKDEYLSYIDEILYDKMTYKNINSENTLNGYADKELVKLIKNEYLSRFKKFKKQYKELKVKKTTTKEWEGLDNFALFLKCKCSEDMARWFILDSVIREFNPEKSLENLQVNPILHLHLNEFTSISENTPNDCLLAKKNYTIYNRYKAEYTEFRIDCEIAFTLLQFLINGDIEEVSLCIFLFFQQSRTFNSPVFKEILIISQAFLLYLFSHLIVSTESYSIDFIKLYIKFIKLVNSLTYSESFDRAIKNLSKEIMKISIENFPKENIDELAKIYYEWDKDEIDIEILENLPIKIQELKEKILIIEPCVWKDEWTVWSVVDWIRKELNEAQTDYLKKWFDFYIENSNDLGKINYKNIKAIN